MTRSPGGPPIRLASTHNARLRSAFSLAAPRERRERGMSLLEGSRFVLDCLRLGAPIRDVFLDESLPRQRFQQLQEAADALGATVFHVAPGILQRLSDQESAEGVAATVEWSEPSLEVFLPLSPLVICHGIQNPGNLGAIVRTAAAFGVGGILGSGGTDPFGPKALRGAAGATFRMPVARHAGSLIDLCVRLGQAGHRLILAQPRVGIPHTALSGLTGKTTLLLGGEGDGFEGLEWPHSLAIQSVRIDLQGCVESLNVAVAAGILLDRLTVRT